MTNFDRGIERVRAAIGRAPYWWWPPSMDTVPDGPGAFAVNHPLPENLVSQMVDQGIFCAGLINVIRRANRKIVATNGDPRYDGGTYAIQNFWAGFAEPFDRWAYYPRGTLIGRYFRWEGERVGDQGHVGVLLEPQDLAHQQDGLLLHSHPGVGGLAKTRLGASHAGWYYEYVVRREDWINHDKGGF